MSVASAVAADVVWLIQNPEFDERPPSIMEFCGPNYLNIEKHLRKRIAAELLEIFGPEFVPGRMSKYSQALITGGIGIGKTTIASIVLPYMVCCTLCLKDPQDYYNLLPGSAIAFMQMSTKASQALAVIFHDTKMRVDNSPWFVNRFPRDPKHKNELKFPKNINIIPGDSLETTFEGYNVLGGILDEMDSHKKTLTKDYAEAGYSTIHARITSRFGDRGFLLLIGQMKSEGGFAMRKYEEFLNRPDTYAVKLTIWEALDAEKFSGQVFYYDPLRSKVWYPEDLDRYQIDGTSMMKIPIEYINDFKNDPDKALRDLAGIPPKVQDPFIRNVDKIIEARHRYDAQHPNLLYPWRIDRIADNLRANNGLRRHAHLDLAYSSETGDAAAVAVGHVERVVITDEGPKPYIVIDVIARILPPPGRQLELSEVREVLYSILGRGFRIKKTTMDGFQSVDTMQMLNKRRLGAEYLSIDKNLAPYQDLRDALYESRIELPPVIMKHKRSDPVEQDVIVKELTELGYSPNGLKIDHPVGGTKDCADAIAGVVHTLMSSVRVRSNNARPETAQPLQSQRAYEGIRHVTQGRDFGAIRTPQVPEWRNDGQVKSPWS